jgi:hypothetical protein
MPNSNNRCRVRAPATTLILLTAFALFPTGSISAAEVLKIPMTAGHWQIEGNAEFVQKDGLAALALKPRNAEMKMATGHAVLNDLVFRDGTIEYDVEATGTMGAGFAFRRRDKDTYEDFYLRPRPNCQEAPDCIQYAPETHGVLLWDLFPQYQSPAPLKESGWNHVKLVVSGRRMNVFINGTKSPSLKIANLEGDALDGGLMLEGPGIYANLTVTPGAVEELPAKPEKDQTQNDRRYLRSWELSPFAPLASDHQPTLADLPAASAPWQPLNAERDGLMNVSREYGLPLTRPERALVWLKTTITSGKEQTKTVKVGWNRELWVFVNGTQVFADKNLYQPPAARKAPDGRCSLENGTFSLPLKQGKNEIVAAVANNFYGWAMIMRLDDAKDVILAHH